MPPSHPTQTAQNKIHQTKPSRHLKVPNPAAYPYRNEPTNGPKIRLPHRNLIHFVFMTVNPIARHHHRHHAHTRRVVC
jgi:hypothetical protein